MCSCVQIMVMFGIGSSGALAAMLSMAGAALVLTDERHRLRMDRLEERPQSIVSRGWCAPSLCLPFTSQYISHHPLYYADR